ncbi:hypothetical protein ACFC0D_19335 [Streptomyces sp. NPDC056222]|uniref:hypothetical protein n=1 Tax=Streptomyces sp. NPDC056222 TaxID=3345749 RepID=UPI0035DAC499
MRTSPASSLPAEVKWTGRTMSSVGRVSTTAAAKVSMTRIPVGGRASAVPEKLP